MDRLEEQVLVLSNARRHGGRVYRVDSSSIALLDCMCWSNQQTERLRAHFPDIGVSVQADKQSLSGFRVIFQAASSGKELTMYLVIAVILACCAYSLLKPPWLVGYAKLLYI